MTDSSAVRIPVGIVHVALEITIQANATRAWQALFHETANWWLADFFNSPKARQMLFEPRVGGKLFEDWGDGAGVTWYSVVGWEPPHALLLQGCLALAFGGPAMTILSLGRSAKEQWNKPATVGGC